MSITYKSGRSQQINGSARAVGYTLDANDVTSLGHTLDALISAGHIIVHHGDVNEVQTVTITGTPTGGTFTLTFDGQVTGAINHNAAAAAVLAALEALSNIAPGDVTVGGGAGPGTPWTVTFVNRGNVPEMTATGSFTGGTSPAVAVTTTTAPVTDRTRLAALGVPDVPVDKNLLTGMISRG